MARFVAYLTNRVRAIGRGRKIKTAPPIAVGSRGRVLMGASSVVGGKAVTIATTTRIGGVAICKVCMSCS